MFVYTQDWSESGEEQSPARNITQMTQVSPDSTNLSTLTQSLLQFAGDNATSAPVRYITKESAIQYHQHHVNKKPKDVKYHID